MDTALLTKALSESNQEMMALEKANREHVSEEAHGTPRKPVVSDEDSDANRAVASALVIE